MEFTALYKTFEAKSYYIFSFEDALSFYPGEDKASLAKQIYRWKKQGWIYPLKRGLYELSYPKDFLIPDLYIANRLYSPSYVSMETALSHHSIIPEVAMAVTSITTKPTRSFKNKHGLFTYRSIKPACFTGYYVETSCGYKILVAEPEKALVDFLYFKTYRGAAFNPGDERLDKKTISSLNMQKIEKYSKSYKLNLKGLYAYL